MTESEEIDYGSCIGCGETVVIKSIQTGDELIRMTHHVVACEDPSIRCEYDFGPFINAKRKKQYPGDTYL